MNNFNIYLYLLISSSFLFSDECLNLDCEGSQDFLCYFTELEDFNSHNECRDYAESNGKEFHGTSFEAEYNCVDPGCYCNENDNPHCFWQESNECINQDCTTDSHFSCYHIEVEDLNNYNECRDHAESNGKEFHGAWYSAENSCVDPGCFCSENGNYCGWKDNGDDCVNEECENDNEFSCRFTELEGLNSYSECREYAESSEMEFHGTWYNAENACVDPGCFCNEYDNHCNWIENDDDCANWECETDPHFSCEFTELAEFNNYTECRDYAESNGKDFDGIWPDAENSCVDPGCFCSENGNYCGWKDSDDCVNEECQTDPYFTCYQIEVEGLNNYTECHDYAESNEIDFHGIWFNAENACVDPGCFCFENDNHCNWIDSEDNINYGCTLSYACNYNPDANIDDGSCYYADGNYDCEGNYYDCNGTMNGDAELDYCGICGGGNYYDDESCDSDCELSIETFTVYGSNPEYGDHPSYDEACNDSGWGEYHFYWSGGCEVVKIESSNGWETESDWNIESGFNWNGFHQSEAHTFMVYFANGGYVTIEDIVNNCPNCSFDDEINGPTSCLGCVEDAWHVTEYNSTDSTGENLWAGEESLGGYMNDWIQFMDTPSLSIGEDGYISAQLFYAIEDYYDAGYGDSCTDGWDAANIRISSDGGESWDLLEDPSNPYHFECGFGWIWNDNSYEEGGHLNHLAPGWGGWSDGWINFNANLNDYANQNIIIRFAFGSDPAVSTMSDQDITGFQVDNIVISDNSGSIYENDGSDEESLTISGDCGLNDRRSVSQNPSKNSQASFTNNRDSRESCAAGPDVGCDGVCFSNIEFDCTGECGGISLNDEEGNCCLYSELDACDICFGDNYVATDSSRVSDTKIGFYASEKSNSKLAILLGDRINSRSNDGGGNRAEGHIINVYSDPYLDGTTGSVWVGEDLYIVEYYSGMIVRIRPGGPESFEYEEVITGLGEGLLYSITYDGNYLWVGDGYGTVNGYTLSGEHIGSFDLPVSTWSALTFVEDGQYFLSSPLWQESLIIYMVDYDGTVIDQYSVDLGGGSITNMVWVPGHDGGNIWTCAEDGSIIRRLDFNGDEITEVGSFNGVPLGSDIYLYAIAHDGVDLWTVDWIGGSVQYDDGVEEMASFVIGPDAGCDGVCFSEAYENEVGDCVYDDEDDCSGYAENAYLIEEAQDSDECQAIADLDVDFNWEGSHCDAEMHCVEPGCYQFDNYIEWQDECDGPSECLSDCPDLDILIAFFDEGEGDLNGEDICTVFVNWVDTGCIYDCDVGEINDWEETGDICSECIVNGDCDGMFGDHEDECEPCGGADGCGSYYDEEECVNQDDCYWLGWEDGPGCSDDGCFDGWVCNDGDETDQYDTQFDCNANCNEECEFEDECDSDDMPECLEDCSYEILNLEPFDDPDYYCELALSEDAMECFSDCGEEILQSIAETQNICSECLEANNCEDQFANDDCGNAAPGTGDLDEDGELTVSDIIMMLDNIIMLDVLDDCQISIADLNDDGEVNIYDIIRAVDIILGGDNLSRFVGNLLHTPTTLELYQGSKSLDFNLDKQGLVGFDFILSHGPNFSVQLNDEAFVSRSHTSNDQTRIVMVIDGGSHLFSTTGKYKIEEMVVGTVDGEMDNVKINHIPENFILGDVYPNPFNPSASFELSIPVEGFASVKIYNIVGQVVGVLHEGNLKANTYSFTWNANDLASGMYLVRAETAGEIAIQKMMLMK